MKNQNLRKKPKLSKLELKVLKLEKKAKKEKGRRKHYRPSNKRANLYSA